VFLVSGLKFYYIFRSVGHNGAFVKNHHSSLSKQALKDKSQG
jgi:hypothetical protein